MAERFESLPSRKDRSLKTRGIEGEICHATEWWGDGMPTRESRRGLKYCERCLAIEQSSERARSLADIAKSSTCWSDHDRGVGDDGGATAATPGIRASDLSGGEMTGNYQFAKSGRKVCGFCYRNAEICPSLLRLVFPFQVLRYLIFYTSLSNKTYSAHILF